VSFDLMPKDDKKMTKDVKKAPKGLSRHPRQKTRRQKSPEGAFTANIHFKTNIHIHYNFTCQRRNR
jgi:hypothetical protein